MTAVKVFVLANVAAVMALLRWLTRLSPRTLRPGSSNSSSLTAPQRATRSTPARSSRGVLGAAWDAIATIILATISVMRVVRLFVLANVAAATAFIRWVAGFTPPMVGPWSSNPGSSFNLQQSSEIATEDDSHGSTPAAWTAVIIITIAFTSGTAAIIVGNWVLFWVSVALVAIGAIAGRVLHSRTVSKRDVNA
ncbi:hypothetical protein OA174_00165 [Actinomycetota bacterium]|nr:hypothetical protein [Actinomycetota bacterium]